MVSGMKGAGVSAGKSVNGKTQSGITGQAVISNDSINTTVHNENPQNGNGTSSDTSNKPKVYESVENGDPEMKGDTVIKGQTLAIFGVIGLALFVIFRLT